MGKEKDYSAFWNELKKSDSSGELAAGEMVSDIISELITIRKKKNVTQRDLAKMTGLKQSAIARIEKLHAIPRMDTIAKIANALNASIQLKPSMEDMETIQQSERKRVVEHWIADIDEKLENIIASKLKSYNYTVVCDTSNKYHIKTDFESDDHTHQTDNNTNDYGSDCSDYAS